MTHVHRQVDDVPIEITLTTIAAYGSFLLAESLHCSGVIATVTAGIMCGHAARNNALSEETKRAVDSHWKWLEFALSSAVFLLLGAELSLQGMIDVWPLVPVGIAAALGARAIVVGIVATSTRSRERVSATWQVVLVWGGLRGALSLVLALAVPASVVERPLVIALTAGAVVFSIIVQGSTMPAVLRKLRISAS